ncbi:MAG: hypothetical protein WCW66_06760 [Patescibacteria group bacterium]|jgi:hypothetical protein
MKGEWYLHYTDDWGNIIKIGLKSTTQARAFEEANKKWWGVKKEMKKKKGPYTLIPSHPKLVKVISLDLK